MDNICGGAVKRLAILIDRLGPVILSALWMNGQVLHCLRAHLKVPGWSSDFITLLNDFEYRVLTFSLFIL